MSSQRLRITQGEHRLISREGIRAPHLFQTSAGNLLLSFHVQADQHFAKRVNLISRDRGESWEQTPQRNHRELAWGETADGTVLAIDRDTFEQREGVSTGLYHRSTDGGLTWEGPLQTEVRIPATASQDYPASSAHYPEPDHVQFAFFRDIPAYYAEVVRTASRRRGFSFWRYTVDLDGRLVAAMQGRFHGDRNGRTVLVESHDQGQSWDFVSTIATDFTPYVDGMVEPVIRQVADGSLLAIIRRNTNHPLAQCRSTDGGRTWSEPELLVAHGVDPDLYLMENGVLAMTYGRPGIHIAFSADGCGHSWGWARPIADVRSSAYTGITEIETGRLLVTYDRVDGDQPRASRREDATSIWATTYQVERA